MMLQAMAFGQADYYGTKPFNTPDERFHRFGTSFLEEWAQVHRPGFQLVRIVGEQWSPRSHEIRDFLDRGGIASGFYDVNSEEGRKLLGAIPEPPGDLPVCILYDARVLVAAGVDYRRLGLERVDRFVGAGVFYGTAPSEAQAMRGKLVYVAGAGNSAGQAAVHLAKYARQVAILVRGESLRDDMSDYLIQEIETKGNISVRLHAEVVDGKGVDLLERLVLRDSVTGETEEVEAAALCVLIGGDPRTEWLPESVLRDEQGYIFTGRDLAQGLQSKPRGKESGMTLRKEPLPMETSMPGVFAAGDVRHGSIKRVASAVGEGATAVRFVHEYLREG